MLMIQAQALLLVLSPLVLASSSQDSALVTPELVAELRMVTSTRLSPDGRFGAYTLLVPRIPGQGEDGSAWSELHVVDVAGERERAFVSGEVRVSGLAWTPDSREIAFLSKRDGDDGTSLYLIPVDGGEARRALELDSSIRSFHIAPDGKRVVCIASPAKDEEREKQRKQGFSQEIYEEDGRSAELWVATLDGSTEPRRVPFDGHPQFVRWSPSADRLLVVWAPTTLVDDGYMKKRVAVLDAASGGVQARIENPGKLGKVAWSPDGTQVAMIAAADLNDPSAGRLSIAPAAGGVPRDLFPGFEGDAVDFEWESAHSLLVVNHVGLWSRFEVVDLGAENGGVVKARVLLEAAGPVIRGLSLSGDGQSALLLASSPEHPYEVFHMRRGDEAPRRLTSSNPALANVRLAQQAAVAYPARDGLELQGVLVYPLERREGERVPLILSVHGGPEAHGSNGWVTSYGNPGQMAAARGFAVFYPNYRGSTGRGVEFSKLSQGDPAGKEFDDLVDTVDYLVGIGLVDTERVGVTGGSYGGYATAWCSTRFTERFAAGVMFVGISDKISKVGTTDIPEEEFHVHARKRIWDDWNWTLERSPIYHAEGARTPLLILHGKEDPRVDPGQSREMYRHLKLRGKAPVRLILYPGEGHGNRRAASRYDYSLRSLRWFEHYLKGPGGDMPAPELEYSAGDAPQDGDVPQVKVEAEG